MSLQVYSQEKIWTEEDRAFLNENLERTKNEIINETKDLSIEQWHFKPSKDSWCIAQVVEHLGLYERIVMQEALVANAIPPRPELFADSRTDKEFIAYMNEEEPHNALDHAIPLGLMEGADNLEFFLYGRNIIIDYIKTTDKDLKTQFIPRSKEPNFHRSVHGLIVVHFGHTDRHLRQIVRIKSNENFPTRQIYKW